MSQTGVALSLYISDDGSSDGTMAILERLRAQWPGGFSIVRGPGTGFASNFRHLAITTPLTADYFAFCDQDDIWDPDKLQAAIAILSERPAGEPALYSSRTRLVDASGVPIGYSPLFRQPPSFQNAIVQNVGGGNTVVFNRRAFELFAESARRTSFLTHDWWAYMIVSGAGGYVHYDPTPHIGYRQHARNIVGKNTGLAARYDRLRRALGGQFSRWTEQNLASLARCEDLLSPETRATLSTLREARHVRGFKALRLLRDAGVYRQTTLSNLALRAAAMTGGL